MRSNIVNIAVCGRFHFHNYVPFLQKEKILNKFYYSHQIGTWKQTGLTPDGLVNAAAKEYLLRAELHLFSNRFAEITNPVYGALWAQQALISWSPAPILHVMAHGYEQPLVSRAKKDGAKVIVEVVNTHPAEQLSTLNAERSRRSLTLSRKHMSRREEKIAELSLQADIILAPSRHVGNSFIKHGAQAERVKVLPYAANLSRFYSRTTPQSSNAPLKVICVGAISLRKGQLYLLEAARALGPEQVSVTLVGRISSDITALLEQYDGAYNYIPSVPNELLVQLLHAHDVFVLPTLEEGLAISNCEAMAAGLCVVTTLPSGAGEMLRHGENGMLVEPASSAALVAALEHLNKNRELTEKLGENAAKSMQVFHNWEIYAEKLKHLYNELAEQVS